jgi:hypothetical protein
MMTPEMITFLQAVIVAAITAGGTVWGISIKNNKDRAVHDAIEEGRFKRLEEMIVELRDKQDKHNNVIERMYKIEADQDTLFRYKDQMESRIETLEGLHMRERSENDR